MIQEREESSGFQPYLTGQRMNAGIFCKNNSVFIMVFAFIIGILFFIRDVFPQDTRKEINAQPIRVGYFYGGRTVILMRSYTYNEFRRDGLEVEFYSKNLYDQLYHLVPMSISEFNEYDDEGFSGKVTGTELVDGIIEGQFDIATIGESSFLYAIHSGSPIVAIAELGHDTKNHPDHVFIIRKGLNTNKSQDYFGKLMVSRRAGPGDEVFLKEFLSKEGIDINKDVLELDTLPKTMEEKNKLPKDKVIIISDVPEDEVTSDVIDGGYFHLMYVETVVPHTFKIIQPANYVANPEISQAILVCHKDFLHNNRERLVKFIETYIKRIRYEHSLSYEERTKERPRGQRLATNFHGLNYPQYDIIPTSSAELLYQMTDLLKKYKAIDNKDLRIEDFIDNSLVLEAAKNLGIKETDDYKPPEY